MNENSNVSKDNRIENNTVKIEKIRVKSGIPIEVNDDGDTITIPVEDMQFMDGFYGMIDKFTDASTRLSNLQTDDTREELNAVIDECRMITQEIDMVFGVDCCKKVFGDIIPSPYVVMDFFDQIVPIIDRYANERQHRISQKYNRNRQGSKKKNYYHKRK